VTEKRRFSNSFRNPSQKYVIILVRFVECGIHNKDLVQTNKTTSPHYSTCYLLFALDFQSRHVKCVQWNRCELLITAYALF